MAYKRQDLIYRLLAFKEEHGRFPTRKDFELKKIEPSKNVFYRAFKSLEKAIQQAERVAGGGEAPVEETKSPPRGDRCSTHCPFCGSSVPSINSFYDTLPQIIVSRYLELLRLAAGDTYQDAVLDCLLEIFGPKDKRLRSELIRVGWLDLFERRFKCASPDSDDEAGSRRTGDRS
jgi:hypothetical protein